MMTVQNPLAALSALKFGSQMQENAVQRPTAAMASQPALSAQPDVADFSSAHGLQAGGLRFGSRLDKNHAVEIPFLDRVGWDQPAQVQLAMHLKALEKLAKDDKSHLLFVADLYQPMAFPEFIAGLADAMTMSPHPVDVMVRAETGPHGLFPLQTATGNRYMNRYAQIVMGPTLSAGGGSSENAGTWIRDFNKARRNLEYVIMERAGVSNRAKVSQDIEDGIELNALRALNYGKHGLVDAIVVGDDEVLTRAALNKFYEFGPRSAELAGRSKAVQEAREAFNRRYASIDEVVDWARANRKLQSFEVFAPGSITDNPTPLQKSALDKDDKDADKAKNGNGGKPSEKKDTEDKPSLVEQLEQILSGDALKEQLNQLLHKLKAEEGKQTKFFKNGSELKKNGSELKLDRVIDIKDKAEDFRIEVAHVPQGATGVYDRDQVILPGGVDKVSIRAMDKALRALVEKKEVQKAAGQDTSNVLLLENTPGGYSFGGAQLYNLMQNSSVPIDVVIQGLGSSCGSVLVSAAGLSGGNRFMTENSAVLLHRSNGSAFDNTRVASNQYRGLRYATEQYIHRISTVSGRDIEEVKKDFGIDAFIINSLESLVYGPKGLVDAVLVGPDEVLMRDDLMRYLTELKGSSEAAEAYVEEVFVKHRSAEYLADEKDFQDQATDPLENPLETLKILKQKGYIRKMSDIERFKPSLGDAAGTDKTIDIYKVTEVQDPHQH